MKTKFIAITCAFFFTLSSLQLSAQETIPTKPYEDGFLKRFGVAAKLGTYGPGIDFHTSLTSNLKARIGFNYLAYSTNEIFDFTADSPDGQSSVPGDITDAKLKFPNANILLDFYPVKSGIFCITAGAYIGNNNVKAKGTAASPFVWDDLIITPVNGKFDANLKMGSTFKPYLGIGLGRTIPNSRVGFRFDIGAVYQGEYTIDSPQSSSSVSGSSFAETEFDLPFSSELLKLWPMLSFSISYRIK